MKNFVEQIKDLMEARGWAENRSRFVSVLVPKLEAYPPYFFALEETLEEQSGTLALRDCLHEVMPYGVSLKDDNMIDAIDAVMGELVW